MKIVRSVKAMQRLAKSWRKQGLRVAFVPTMGALHEGHISLMRKAVRAGDIAVASIFVNPLQFGPKEDFKRYPRTLAQDRRMLQEAGVAFLFCPDAAEIFPEGFAAHVSIPALSRGLCGAFRPGHFDGVATVVAKLLLLTGATEAYFGQKDYQQAVIVRRMVRDLNLDVAVKVMPIVRERDGLAMSSRNRYLFPEQRARAPVLYRALAGVRQAVKEGNTNAKALENQAKSVLRREGIHAIDYVSIVDGDNLQPLKKVRPPAVIAGAIRLGRTRLIDNVILA